MKRRKQRGTSDLWATRRRPAGFTLIELMVVIAIIGILATIALVSIRTTSYAGTVEGFANQIAAECDIAVQRAVASKRWQRLDVKPERIEHWESTTEGMAPATTWQLVRTINAPHNVAVVSIDYATHIDPNDSVPATGANLDGAVQFAPDGLAEAATIFLGDRTDKNRYRVAIYRASGTAYVFNEW